MAIELRFAPEVEQDIGEAALWYEEQRRGLGDEYLKCVADCIEVICRSPELFATVVDRYRRALVRRFPYANFDDHYDSVVTVYGVLPTARDPEKWRERLA